MSDPFGHLTHEQKQLFVGAQTELQAMLIPFLSKYGQVFDEQALIYSLMITVARAARSATPPIDARGWAHASATCFEVAGTLNLDAAAAEEARRAILVNG